MRLRLAVASYLVGVTLTQLGADIGDAAEARVRGRFVTRCDLTLALAVLNVGHAALLFSLRVRGVLPWW